MYGLDLIPLGEVIRFFNPLVSLPPTEVAKFDQIFGEWMDGT